MDVEGRARNATYLPNDPVHLQHQPRRATVPFEYSRSRQPVRHVSTTLGLLMAICYVVSGHAGAKHRPNDLRINVIWQDRQIICIQHNVFLETAILVEQVICAVSTVLLLARQTEFTAPTDSTRKSNPNQIADLDVFCTAGTQAHDSSNTLMATNMWELISGDRVAVCTNGGASFGVEVCYT